MLLDCLGVRLELYLSGVYVYRADSLLTAQVFCYQLSVGKQNTAGG